MACLKLNGLNKVYPSGEVALYNINLETANGEFLVVVGGEASGKSTLLRIISGLEYPDSGAVEVDGVDVTDSEPKDRDVAVVFKGDTLSSSLNVFENLAYGLRKRKASDAVVNKRVKAVSEILGLNDVLTRKPKTLTAAARQRVAIGRAVVREPSLYLFDEPLSGLDDKLSTDILNVIVNLQARMEGTFVYATKNLSEALAIGTRTVVLKEGLVQQIDTPANLYDYPANAYVAFFIGSPAINFLNGTKIVKNENGYSAVSGDIKLELSEKVVSRFENISDYADTEKTVILGIRPEDAVTAENGGVKGKTVKVETDGGTAFAEIAPEGGISMIVTVQKPVKSGEFAAVKVDADRLYIFDSETRLTLLKRDGGYRQTGYKDADFIPLSYEEELKATKKEKLQKDKKKK